MRRLLFPAFSLLCVFVRSVFILLRKEEFVFLCVVVCFFSRACVFFEDTCAKTKKKEQKIGGRKIHHIFDLE
jgi:UDP-N-acetylmuramyl pentapeptide phosphotransferase/UDP-N-acetylglucosamine-1-phosphate transferase